MTTTTYPAGARLRCPVCAATTVVVVEGTRGAWCSGGGRHRGVAMRVVEKEEARR